MDNSKLLNFLQANQIMSLAVSSENIPWISNVFYVVDDDFNFFFYSYPESRHIKTIKENHKVATAIYDHSCNHDLIIGAQMSGTVSVLADEKIFRKGFGLYFSKFKEGVSEHPVFEEGFSHIAEAFYLFRPKYISYRNSEEFEGERVSKLD